jgi:hypothetical protein
MRRIPCIVLTFFLTGTAFGQVLGTSGGGTIPGVAGLPIFYGPSTTATDRDGNLYVFDVQYSYATPTDGTLTRAIRVPVSIKSRVIVIPLRGSNVIGPWEDVVYQLIGTGNHAVYAIVTPFGISTTRPGTAAKTELVAFPGAGAPVKTPLQFVGNVQFTASVDTDPDVLSIAEYGITTLLQPAGTAAPLRQRRAQIIRYDQTLGFQVSEPVVIPN